MSKALDKYDPRFDEGGEYNCMSKDLDGDWYQVLGVDQMRTEALALARILNNLVVRRTSTAYLKVDPDWIAAQRFIETYGEKVPHD